MKHLLEQLLKSWRFMIGFGLFAFILLVTLVYPLIITHPPLQIIGQGTFFPPGIYVNVYDSVNSPKFMLNLSDAAAKRIATRLNQQERLDMEKYLVAVGVPLEQIDTTDTKALLDLWNNNYDPKKNIKGMTNAQRNAFVRLNVSLSGLLSTEGATVATKDASTGTLQEAGTINQNDYVNVNQVANVLVLPLGTDNFGRDVLTELISAIGTSLVIGFVAGITATSIGLILGLLSGFIGGVTDDAITFVTNLFTVIPSFVLLILISYGIGQEKRGAVTIAVVIGITSWVWTARAVRSQVISLRNRDHVNMSRLSGHPLIRIIFTDIMPYIASYVFMALILQISSAILAEAGLSILGLGPRTTTTPTLGLMMQWAMIYSAHILGKWWAYFPVIVAIGLISFSLNLMNTGLDQIYNPALRE